MKVTIENKDRILMENAYFENEEKTFGIYGCYGLTHIEIYQLEDKDKFLTLTQKEFLKLYELMTAMKAEINRLENL